jgi:hypothetical protein
MARLALSLATACLPAILAAAGGCADNRTAGPYPIAVGNAYATVDVAADPETRATGLSGRRSLENGHGMLFLFPEETTAQFWMKGTYVPLSIAFVTSGGQIAEIQDMVPETLDKHGPERPFRMALEMPVGWFVEKGVRAGDRVSLPPELAKMPVR